MIWAFKWIKKRDFEKSLKINNLWGGGMQQLVAWGTAIVGCMGLRKRDRKSTRLNSSHQIISYAGFCLKKKKVMLYSRSSSKLIESLSMPFQRDHIQFSSFRLPNVAHSHLSRPLYLFSLAILFFNDTATTEIYTLSLHDALPISFARSERRTSPPPSMRAIVWTSSSIAVDVVSRSEEHTSELQSPDHLVCRL